MKNFQYQRYSSMLLLLLSLIVHGCHQSRLYVSDEETSLNKTDGTTPVSDGISSTPATDFHASPKHLRGGTSTDTKSHEKIGDGGTTSMLPSRKRPAEALSQDEASPQLPSQAATSIASTQGAALSSTQVTDSQNLDTHIASEKKSTPRIKRDGDFKDLVTQSTIFADKSLFIKDIIEDSDTALLLAMPRRWGKTVNLDMLRRFLEIPVDDNGKVIDGIATANHQIFRKECVLQPDSGKSLLKISQSKILVQNPEEDMFYRQEVDALKLQGTYPVIYIDFKNCKSDRFDTVREGVKRVLNSCFKQHRYLEKSDHLDEEEKEKIKRYVGAISSEGLNDNQIKSGLQFLSEMLYQHYDKKKVWILIDEYDAVANVAYRKFNTDDLDKTIELFAGIYETALKSNPYLEKGVLTGVQYIAQSGMLSGLNNLGKFNFTDAKYAQYYGLDQSEVDLFFNHFEVPKPLGDKAKSCDVAPKNRSTQK